MFLWNYLPVWNRSRNRNPLPALFVIAPFRFSKTGIFSPCSWSMAHSLSWLRAYITVECVWLYYHWLLIVSPASVNDSVNKYTGLTRSIQIVIFLHANGEILFIACYDRKRAIIRWLQHRHYVGWTPGRRSSHPWKRLDVILHGWVPSIGCKSSKQWHNSITKLASSSEFFIDRWVRNNPRGSSCVQS